MSCFGRVAALREQSISIKTKMAVHFNLSAFLMAWQFAIRILIKSDKHLQPRKKKHFAKALRDRQNSPSAAMQVEYIEYRVIKTVALQS